MGNLRKPETQLAYRAYVKGGGLDHGCRICEAPAVKDFQYWKIIRNSFPYDRIAVEHDMIVPKRHTTEQELSKEEWAEFQKIKTADINTSYEYLIEAVHKLKSIPGHFHLHLIVAND